MSETILEVKQLTKRYGKQLALNNFDLTVSKGEIVGIAGRNGAGKTTLFRIITGLTPEFSGSLSLFGSLDEQGALENRHFVGTIIEAPAFFPDLTAKQNLEYYRIQRNIKDQNRVDEMLALVDLADTRRKKFKEFSLGMKQRLAIALALLHRPQLLIFDEPTNGLDPTGIIQVRDLLLKLAQEEELTILVSSHILTELEHLATRFVIIEQGNKIDEFTKGELQERIQSYYEIRVNKPLAAINILQTAFPDAQMELDTDELIKVYDLNIPAEDLADTLFQNEFKLSHLVRKTHKLEEVFLNMIESKGRDTRHV
ncbi:ATP-binding cassette domain-containing protein [Aerococcaceae bacterium DSM 109653]|uniref:ATP-binding cassette domain-containing protein n=1 Tax=Fundicoccus ignavus TaxID=2664442 RepID=A0A6I2GCY9_9LACT|nr:ABC transporter ATP-binding protein [Fundicoccus ignavus]MRI82511.1 ATP-binding cassette domain-containing protein [Fundicoccus ignavus]MRI85650.1 ATP-binding cassette domain-containing protein [Fundicoccus ignavus]